MKTTSVGKEVIEHWYSLVHGQNFSSRDFYDEVERAVADQRIPSLQSKRVDLSEGGVLSDKREYLRFNRERLYFDVCAAPVGVNYFFSFRFYALPPVVRWWEIAAVLAFLWFLFELSVRHVGLFLGPALLVAACALAAWTARNAIGLGLRDLDASLLRTPVVGPIYERFLRKDSYFRQDVRIAYGSIVSGIVKQEAERVTAAKGALLVREFCYSPVFDGLYKARERSLPEGARGTPVPAEA